MHDPTEGGLASGLWELARAADVGLLIDREAIAILPETARLCAEYDLDPLGLIASGSLLVTLGPQDAPRVLAEWHKASIEAAVIGRVVPRQEGVKLRAEGVIRNLPRFERDEIARLFEE
jgi:hydrogenase expression/formation protein HypE